MNSCRPLSISRRTKSSEEASSTSQRRNLSRTSNPFFHAEKRQHLSSRCLFLFSFLHGVLFFFFFFCLTTKRTHLIKESIWNFACYFQSVRRLLAYQHLVATLGIVFFSLFVISRAGMETKRRNDKDDNKQTNIKPIDQSLRRRTFFCLCVVLQQQLSVTTPLWHQSIGNKIDGERKRYFLAVGAIFSFRLVLTGLTNGGD